MTWSVVSAIPADDWRFVTATDATVAAASLTALELSTDGGKTWQAAALPANVTQVKALAVDGRGGLGFETGTASTVRRTRARTGRH